MSKAPIRLTPMECDSGAWKKVEAFAAARIAAKTEITTNPNHSEAARYEAAVRISELKELLKLALPAQEKPGAAG